MEIKYKPGQVAELLDVSTMTVRNYVNEFGEYLSEEANRKRGRRFSNDDIETMQLIRGHIINGLTYAEAKDKLEARITAKLKDRPLTGDVWDEAPQDQQLPPDQSNAIAPAEWFEFFNNMLEAQQDQHQETIRAKDEQIAQLQNELSWQRLPWFRKLFYKPPDQ